MTTRPVSALRSGFAWRSSRRRLEGLIGRPSLPLVVVAALAIVALVQQVWIVDRAIDHDDMGMLGRDFALHMEATRSWLAGGPFYHPYQLAGPYDVPWGQILYPPQALALFVPFTLLGGPLFVLIPTAITAWVIASHRPRLWAWGAIAADAIAFPLVSLPWLAGNPTVWVVALVALSTRYPWTSAFLWFKPSVFPFALAGFRDPRWWAVTILTGVSALILWPMTSQWITAILNARGENSGLLYSLSPLALAAPSIPVIAWLGRTRRPVELATATEERDHRRQGQRQVEQRVRQRHAAVLEHRRVIEP